MYKKVRQGLDMHVRRCTLSYMQAEILTTDEVADYLRVHPRTVLRMAERGTIKHSKVGGQYRFRRADIEAMVAPVEPDSADDHATNSL